MRTLKKLLESYRMELLYLVFGVATTVINYGLFWGMDQLLHQRAVLFSNFVAFVGATAFAYLTNKVWVFHSYSWKLSVILRESATFVSARLFSFGVEEAGLFLCDKVFAMGELQFGFLNGIMVAKIVLSFVAVVMNYFFSKFLVFSRGAKQGEGREWKQ